jgi:hypothetical protein
MNSTAKIAIGVCVGILMALSVISTYSHIAQARAEALQVQRDGSIQHLSPDDLLSKCGSPASDNVRVLTREGSADRELHYDRATITFLRAKSDDGWHYLSAQDDLGKSIRTPRSLPTLLPCLEKNDLLPR